MGLKWRDGRPYFYRSRREGGRVRSEYVASGEVALAMAMLEAEDREEEAEERAVEAREVEKLDDLERVLIERARGARGAAFEALERAGYHRHKRGEWRKRREQSTGEAG